MVKSKRRSINFTTMENQKNSSPINSPDEKFSARIWLFALAGMIDLFVYCILLSAGLPSDQWLSTLSTIWFLIIMVGMQGILFAFLGMAIIAAARKTLLKRGLNFKRFVILNAIGFLLLGIVPLIIFLPDYNNSDYGFGMALYPVFIFPFFNLARFFLLLVVSILIVNFSDSA
ncbi:MAG: hypothetical protein ACR2HG_15795 [Pyrinomonadaceae bacterium]